MSELQSNLKIMGRPTSPGVATGPAFIYQERLVFVPEPYEIERSQAEQEIARIEQTIETVLKNLKVSAQRIGKRVDPKLAAVFQTHGAMLQDPVLRQEIRHEVETELVNAEQAVTRVLRRWERRFQDMSEAVYRQKADDVADLRRRLLREMAGVEATPLERLPKGRILVARRLLPSDTVALPCRSVLGVVLEFGGPGSHAALLARGMGIPTVSGLANVTTQIADGDTVIVDGASGEVVVRPDATELAAYRKKSVCLRATVAMVKRRCQQPAQTQDGTLVRVLANVGGRQAVVAAAENGADGIGLCRIEQYYLSRNVPPTAEELLAELRAMFAPVKGKPITIRLLDLGGDKPVPFLKLPPEDNPFLGRRGVRLLLHYPDVIVTQLKALLEFSRDFDIRILVPMVTLAEEMAQVRQQLTAVAKEVGPGRIPPLGAMIETPAAALSVGDIIQHADFLSIGTNDLTQYTMAAGRENPWVADYFQEDHPAVLRLMRIVLEEAGGVPVEVCGELAGQPDAVPMLLTMGVRILSVAPPLVPAIKDAVRRSRVILRGSGSGGGLAEIPR